MSETISKQILDGLTYRTCRAQAITRLTAISLLILFLLSMGGMSLSSEYNDSAVQQCRFR